MHQTISSSSIQQLQSSTTYIVTPAVVLPVPPQFHPCFEAQSCIQSELCFVVREHGTRPRVRGCTRVHGHDRRKKIYRLGPETVEEGKTERGFGDTWVILKVCSHCEGCRDRCCPSLGKGGYPSVLLCRRGDQRTTSWHLEPRWRQEAMTWSLSGCWCMRCE